MGAEVELVGSNLFEVVVGLLTSARRLFMRRPRAASHLVLVAALVLAGLVAQGGTGASARFAKSSRTASTSTTGAATAATATTTGLPAGFQESVVFSGLTQPTAVRFASDGRIFVAEKSGIIKVFDSLTDTTPTVFADLSTNVYNFWDRGLLGLALDPNFPTTPYVYVLYTYDAEIGGTAPKYGTPGVLSDPCPNPPGATADGCVVSGRLSRLQANGDVMTGSEQVLINDWCQQYPSLSVGSLVFGQDGALYASAGTASNFNFDDWGQDGNPLNPCGDPPGGVGATLTPPTAEGGSLRAQDVRTTGDPTGLDGTIIRIDPATGAAPADNPLASSSDPNTRRIIAYGVRNPFRMTLRPGTNELWFGDVGTYAYEELNRIVSPSDSTVENFGWPCYEGPNRQPGFDAANLDLCESLYAQGGPPAGGTPYFSYAHASAILRGRSLPDRELVDLGGGVLHRQLLPRSVPGRPLLRRLLAQLHLVRAERDQRPAGHVDDDRLRCRRVGSGRPRDGPERRSLLRRLHRRHDQANPVHRCGAAAADRAPTTSATWRWTSATNGWGPVEKDKSNGGLAAGDGHTITLNGTTYTKGLGTNAVSDIRYALSGGCSRFRADVGVDDEITSTRASVVFQVFADGTKLYDSGVMGATTATKSIDVNLTGKNELQLVVTDAGNGNDSDHADWAAARIDCGNGSIPPPPSGHRLPQRPQLDVGDERLGPGREGQEQRWPRGGRRAHDHAERDHVHEGAGHERAFPTSATRSRAAAVASGPTSGWTTRSRRRAASVVFQVFADGTKLYDSGVMGATTATKSIDVNLTGKNELQLVVTDAGDGNDSDHADWAAARIDCGAPNTPPTPTITSPPAGTTWKVGDLINFSGSATDAEDGTLPGIGALVDADPPPLPVELPHAHRPDVDRRRLRIVHRSRPRVPVVSRAAADRDRLRRPVDDDERRAPPAVRRADVRVEPQRARSSSSNSVAGTTPFTRTVITGSTNTISAGSPQTLNGTNYVFSSWSDGGAASHNITADASATYTATYAAQQRLHPADFHDRLQRRRMLEQRVHVGRDRHVVGDGRRRRKRRRGDPLHARRLRSHRCRAPRTAVPSRSRRRRPSSSAPGTPPGNVEPINSQLIRSEVPDTTRRPVSIACNGSACSAGCVCRGGERNAVGDGRPVAVGLASIQYTLDGCEPDDIEPPYLGAFFRPRDDDGEVPRLGQRGERRGGEVAADPSRHVEADCRDHLAGQRCDRQRDD